MIALPRLFFAGIGLGIIGCLFYANFREPIIVFDLIPAFAWLTLVDQPILLPRAISEWVPSFLHVMGMCLITAGLLGVYKKRYWQIPLVWLAIGIVFESLQYYETRNVFTWGHFEWVDVLAMVTSASIVALLFKAQTQKRLSVAFSNGVTKLIMFPLLFSASVSMTLGSYSYHGTSDDDDYVKINVEPIYVSWDRIRASGELASAIHGEDYQQPLTAINKIYTYQDLLLINDKNVGVHIFDNKDPENPQYVDFISLMGNQDMAIKDNYLYLDSFTDLVVFDLNTRQKVVRQQNMFNLQDASELIPEYTQFSPGVNLRKGVVVGYAYEDGTIHYFWSAFKGLED